MNTLRKLLLTPIGLALLCIISFYVSFSLMSGFTNPITILFSLAGGLIMGTRLSEQYNDSESYAYIRKNVYSNRTQVTRKFYKVVQREEIPRDRAERAEFLEFLDGLEKMNDRSTSKQLASLIFVVTMCLLSITLTPRLNLINLMAVFVIIMCVYTYMRSRMTVKKIAHIRANLAGRKKTS